MKNFIKFILSFICNLILIPLLICLTICTTWYILPEFQNTFIGEWLQNQFPDQTFLITSIMILGCFILFFILAKIFKVIKSSKINNFYTHLVTWMLSLLLLAESLFTFFMSKDLSSLSFNLTLIRKVGIVMGGICLLLYGIISPKFKSIVDRKIQAYDTAKELNVKGRSSIIWVHILKTFDFCFPEIILMITLCFAFNFSISLYFIYIMLSFVFPIAGNIICDFRMRKEAVRVEQEKIDAQINSTAEAVVNLLKGNL